MRQFRIALAIVWVPSLVTAQPDETPGSDPSSTNESMADGETIVVGPAPAREAGTASAVTLGTRALALAPAKSADELVRLVPGFHISQHGSEGKAQQFFVRGFDAVHGSDVAVHVGILPVNELSNVHGTGYVDLGFVIPEVVRGLRADKGSYRLDQGNYATAGSLRFELGVGRGRRGARSSYELGSTGRHRLTIVLAPQDEAEETFAAAELTRDAGFGVNRESRRATFLGQKNGSLGGVSIVATTGIYGARFGEPGVTPLALYDRGLVAFDGTLSPDTSGSSGRAFVAIAAEVERPSRHTQLGVYATARRLDLRENFTGSLAYPDTGDAFHQRQRGGTAGATGRHRARIASWLTLDVGADALLDAMQQGEERLDRELNPWQVSRELDAVHALASMHAGALARLGSLGQIQAGLRLDGAVISARDAIADAEHTAGMAAPSPRVLFELWPTRGVDLSLAYGRGLRLPEARAVIPSTDFMAPSASIARSDHLEFGGRARLGDMAMVHAALFGAWLSNELVFDHASAQLLERGTTRRLGAEAGVQIVPASWAELRADVTAVHGRFTRSGASIPNAPPFLATIGGDLLHPRGWMASLLLRHIASRPLPLGARAQPQTVIDASAGWRSRTMELRAIVDNVLGTRFREAEFHYASAFAEERSNLPQLHFAPGRPRTARLVLTAWF